MERGIGGRCGEGELLKSLVESMCWIMCAGDGRR
ncbi:hypothetical protein M316_0040 [Nitrincola phage 1M3-16]|nr:hypothetical protein GJ22_gp112 [Nitrincola phage 1M3-16]AHX01105.1 hypothetical protein M316_0040 [Nitrincola phage 1M3-16]